MPPVCTYYTTLVHARGKPPLSCFKCFETHCCHQPRWGWVVVLLDLTRWCHMVYISLQYNLKYGKYEYLYQSSFSEGNSVMNDHYSVVCSLSALTVLREIVHVHCVLKTTDLSRAFFEWIFDKIWYTTLCGLGVSYQSSNILCLSVWVCMCVLVVFLPQDFLTASSGLAAAEPVWPVWTQDRSATQSPPQGALWNWGQPRSRQSFIWWPSNREGNEIECFDCDTHCLSVLGNPSQFCSCNWPETAKTFPKHRQVWLYTVLGIQ